MISADAQRFVDQAVEQGFPAVIEDPVVLDQVAAVMRMHAVVAPVPDGSRKKRSVA